MSLWKASEQGSAFRKALNSKGESSTEKYIKFVERSEKKSTYKLYDKVKTAHNWNTAHKVELAQHSFRGRHFDQEILLIIIINC